MGTEKKDNVESVATEASENKDDDELTIDTEGPPAAGEWSQAILEKKWIYNSFIVRKIIYLSLNESY